MRVDPTAGRREIELRHETPCTYLALIVVDSACRVKFSFWDTNKGDEARRFLSADRKGLRPEIEELVAARIASRNRAAMVAKVLDWNQPDPGQREASRATNPLTAKIAR